VNDATRNSRSLHTKQSCCRLIGLFFVLSILACSAWAQGESLGEYARRIRAQKKHEVLVSAEDGRKLLQSVDEITQFSSQDSGLPKLTPIRRRLIGRAEAENHFKSKTADEAQNERRVNDAAVVLKKFGMLPPQFELSSALGDFTLNALAGFYQFDDKTMYLLNWVPPEMQKSVMAHELTHALQDQNFQLASYIGKPQPTQQQMSMEHEDAAEISLARRAVVEGQASLVECDYSLAGMDVNLADSASAREMTESYLQGSYDPPVTINNAPRLLREIMIFPYREGLKFELELLNRGGRQLAFQGAFKRPPLNTHQILQPEAYLNNEKNARVTIGDLKPVFGDAYEAYDSGNMGELDVQIMSEEFGRENDIYTVARKWDGGAYVAVKRSGLPADAKVTTADLALVYLSRWKTQKAAERFGQIYLEAIAKRLPMGVTAQRQCDEETCPAAIWELHAQSSEGPVNIELWPGNLLIVTQSVDEARMKLLRPILLAPASSDRASAEQELSPRLLALPQIQALSDQAGLEMLRQIQQQLKR
jgi:hypothetical protein